MVRYDVTFFTLQLTTEKLSIEIEEKLIFLQLISQSSTKNLFERSFGNRATAQSRIDRFLIDGCSLERLHYFERNSTRTARAHHAFNDEHPANMSKRFTHSGKRERPETFERYHTDF